MSYLIVLVALAVALFVISEPFRRQRRSLEAEGFANRRAELEAARDAKYLEIRDAEMDLHTGKLSDEDYAAVDGGLRSEAIEIMHALDAIPTAEADDLPRPGTPGTDGASADGLPAEPRSANASE